MKTQNYQKIPALLIVCISGALITNIAAAQQAPAKSESAKSENIQNAPAAKADLHYYMATVAQLGLEKPVAPEDRSYDFSAFPFRQPRAVLDGAGEIYIKNPANMWDSESRIEERTVVLAVPAAAGEIRGRLFVTKAGGDGMEAIPFIYKPAAAGGDPESTAAMARASFYELKQTHYNRLLDMNVAGAAWFRHQSEIAYRERGIAADNAAEGRAFEFRTGAVSTTNTYELFTGGRALSENLQLDRQIAARAGGEETIDIATIPGITVAEFDWNPIIKDLHPESDVLAKFIPFDQHAIFFSGFQQMLDVLDSADRSGTPVVRWFDAAAEDAGTADRYKKQLILDASDVARVLGPQVVTSVALTGGDPYLKMGTDVAVLFESKLPIILKGYLGTRYKSYEASGAKMSAGEYDGVGWVGVTNEDRSISSYMASLSQNTVVVTNSMAQLTRLVEVMKGGKSIATEKEYIYFRDRYKKGEGRESAFVILTDATIRRWCSPRWRIADSRRARALATMMELQSRRTAELAKGNITNTAADAADLPAAGEMSYGPRGVISKEFGTIEFMTPVSEMKLDKITENERAAYVFLRDRYQSDWRTFFDPIAACVSLAVDRVDLDLTVMPLIGGSEYNEWIDVTRGASLPPGAGDPHEDAFLHLVFGMNPQSRAVTSVGRVVKPAGLDVDPMSWVGNYAALYFDKDPFWADLAKVTNAQDFIRKDFWRVPAVFMVEVGSALKLAGFLTAARSFIETSAPGLLKWESLTHEGQSYVQISSSEEGEREMGEFKNIHVYYAATPSAFIVTLNEGAMKRALGRQAARRAAKESGKEVPAARPWAGQSVAARADGSCLDSIELVLREDYQKKMQQNSWSNLMILNEWKREFPELDPVAVHERIYKTKLVCPGGGNYIWDEKWQTMSSTVFGHPAMPKTGANMPEVLKNLGMMEFGLTFENSGLRAVVGATYK